MPFLNYHHLRYFRLIARELSVSRAAKKLNLSAPALSIQLKQLEQSLGHTLLERRRGGLVLTEVVYLRAHDATIKDLEAWLDMRQSALNALIDIIVQGNGTLSKSKRKHKLVEGLSEEQIDRIEKTVSEHFENYIDSRA